MKIKWEKNKDNSCETATEENYEKLQVIFITDATFSLSFVNSVREKHGYERSDRSDKKILYHWKSSIPKRIFLKMVYALAL